MNHIKNQTLKNSAQSLENTHISGGMNLARIGHE